MNKVEKDFTDRNLLESVRLDEGEAASLKSWHMRQEMARSVEAASKFCADFEPRSLGERINSEEFGSALIHEMLKAMNAGGFPALNYLIANIYLEVGERIDEAADFLVKK